LTSSSNPDDPLKAKVSRTSGSLDPKSRTLLAEIDLPNKSGLLLPGAYFIGKIELEHHPNVISIPSTAVGVEKAGKFVFVVAGGKAKRVPVTTGFDNGAFTEITDGLKGDKEVVVTGRDNLTAGAPVTTTAWVPKKKPAKK
jgi:RND family efflux transporter MFP subunit